MLKIRLMRIGAKKKPFYRIVVMEERSKRTGGYIELLGTYNPLTEPKDIKLNKDRIEYWISQGAQPSVGYLRVIGKAPQRLPRKPKKEAKKETPKESAPAVTKTPEASQTETPVKEVKTEEVASAQPTETPTGQSAPVEAPAQEAETNKESTPEETKE